MYQMASIDFPNWLQDQMDKMGWRPRDLAKRAHISDAVISRILRSERGASIDTLLAIASALNVSPITMFRKAGFLPDGDGDDINFDDWKYLLEKLTPEDQDEIRRIANMKIDNYNKPKGLKRNPQKAG
jgi:transcriptional regulator with XRE-family HTH domain